MSIVTLLKSFDLCFFSANRRAGNCYKLLAAVFQAYKLYVFLLKQIIQ